MHGYLIRVGRTTAPLFYRGGLAFGRDPWTYEPALAAWYASEDAAQEAADTLPRWHDYATGDRAIEYHHWPDRATPPEPPAVPIEEDDDP